MFKQQANRESESNSHIRRGQNSGTAQRLPVIAVLLGAAAVLASLAIGHITYRYSVKTQWNEHKRFCLNEAKTLAAYAGTLEGLSDQALLKRIHTLWNQTSGEHKGEYLCIVDQDAKLILHTTHPDTVGNFAGHNAILREEPQPHGQLLEVVQSQATHVGGYISSAGQPQIAAFTPITARQWCLGVHRAKAEVMSEIHTGMLPQFIGLIMVCGGLFPLSMLLLYRTFSTANRSRQQALKQLAFSQFVIDYSSEAIYWVDESGKFFYVNDSACQATGYSLPALLEMSVWDIDVDHSEDMWPDHWQRVRQQKTVTFESQHRTKGNEIYPVEVTVNHVYYEDREYQCGFVRDISQRKAVEQALRSQEEQYRTLVENTPDTMMRFDRQCRHLYVSPSVEKLTQIPAARFLNKTYGDLGFDVENCQFREAAIEEVFHLARPLEREVQCQFGDSPKIIDWRLFPEFNERGEVATVMTIAKDITEQRKAQEDYETLFREMIDGFAVHEIICDDEGKPVDYRFLAVNPAFERMTGYKAEQLIGKTVLEVMPDVEDHWIETYGRVSLTDDSVHFENYSKALDRYWEVTAFRPGKGQFACIFVDITSEKKLEKDKTRLTAQLERSQRLEMIGTLAGGIAHDFNNILTPIAGFVKMALADVPEEDRLHKDLKEIGKATGRAINLVQQMLAFSRQSDSRRSVMLVGPVIEEAVALIKHSLPASISVELHVDPDCPRVWADSTQMYQVLINLCTNATHAMQHAGGHMEIRLHSVDIETDRIQVTPELSSGCYVRLAVSDNGEGIDPAVLDRIFDPFFTTKSVGQGTGLGLSVVHGIVKSHGGDIVATSRLGEGTTFEVYLPALEGLVSETDDVQVLRSFQEGQEQMLVVDQDTVTI
ncbi:MAG: PAS domain S-box protein [Phycisphaeraceae bacterium]|nr:PAS domain S-box protein [Phycisphaeraceae bacterium]